MEVEFSSNRLERCANDYRAAVQEWGVAVARRYMARIRLIRSAGSFNVLRSNRSLRLHLLAGRRQGQYAIDLTNRWRLIILPGQSESQVVVVEVTQHYDC